MEGREAGLTAPDSPAGIRRYRVIVNRAAKRGGKARVHERIAEAMAGEHVEFLVPATRADAIEACSRAAGDGITDLVVAGGDGTINLALNAIAAAPVRLGVIPCGTANDLATYLGIPKDPAAACAILKQGRTRVLDLVDVNGKRYATAGGAGTVSRVAVNVNRFKRYSRASRWVARRLGSAIYLGYSFFLLLFSRRLYTPVEVFCDGQSVGRFPSVALFVNNQPTIGKRVMPTPDARPDDGELSGMLLSRRSRLGTIVTVSLMSLRGHHTARRDAVEFHGERIEIRAEQPILFIGDGEVLAKDTRLTITIHPGALEILC
ncbi:MAG: YegS/Rv2252/BmrU family lipid kinase [Candidatus Sericytochromatia bacterium]|nr:YegS/Rv2252/BmrU family lipid kinase [Candidatus Tanganyikabacteria bacterium]